MEVRPPHKGKEPVRLRPSGSPACSSAWKSAWFGTRRSGVRVPPRRSSTGRVGPGLVLTRPDWRVRHPHRTCRGDAPSGSPRWAPTTGGSKPGWWNSRHATLRTLCPLRACRCNSCLGHAARWWNSRHAGFRSRCPSWRAGATPALVIASDPWWTGVNAGVVEQQTRRLQTPVTLRGREGANPSSRTAWRSS